MNSPWCRRERPSAGRGNPGRPRKSGCPDSWRGGAASSGRSSRPEPRTTAGASRRLTAETQWCPPSTPDVLERQQKGGGEQLVKEPRPLAQEEAETFENSSSNRLVGSRTCVCILHQDPQCIRVYTFHLHLLLLGLPHVAGEHGRKVVRHGRENQSVRGERLCQSSFRENGQLQCRNGIC